MYGVPVEEVPKTPALRCQSYQLRAWPTEWVPAAWPHAWAFSLDEAKALMLAVFQSIPWRAEVARQGRQRAVRLGYSVTTIGRKRFYNLPDESLKRLDEDEWRKQIAPSSARGRTVQSKGCNADMTKLALINLRGSPERLGRPHR